MAGMAWESNETDYPPFEAHPMCVCDVKMEAEAELGVVDKKLRERAQKRMEKRRRRQKQDEVGFDCI